MDRITKLFSTPKKVLSIYLTAGYPSLESTLPLCQALEKSGVDLIEIGFPFSDPLADGPTIQRSSEAALRNGMTLKKLFQQLQTLRPTLSIPVLLMGYINPVLQYGVERFIADCARAGIDGVILPDLPRDEYLSRYESHFKQAGLHFISLITPTTSEARIREIDQTSTGFIYAVSSAAITGGTLALDAERERYFKKLQGLKLQHPLVVGFGISDRASFEKASEYAHGAIVGSAFINTLDRNQNDPISAIPPFIASLRTAQ